MAIAEIIAERTVKSLFEILTSKSQVATQKSEEVHANVSQHLLEVSNWTARIQFYGMSSAESTDGSTVGLRMNSIPRKFRGQRSVAEKHSEYDLIDSPDNYILLGDPGAGKTTTIKRLARRLLQEPPNGSHDKWQYPIIVRLREVEGSRSLFRILADLLGIKYERREWSGASKEELLDEANFLFVGDEELREVIPKILNATQAVVFLDGLDELPVLFRDKFENDVIRLTLRLESAKIILSCRSGDYVRHLDGFEVVELCPLDESQIEYICRKWLDDPDAFLSKLHRLPARDLTDRPLFLAQLMVVFLNAGYLPEQPCALYRRVVRLLLEDWDEKRGVRRQSKYSNFDSEQKMDFLSALSFQLTCEVKVKRFSTDTLVRAYSAICDIFSLPAREALEVARELETHTGIIVESGLDAYEFSHLSLQEYLCAYYLVREPFTVETIRYLRDYPAPIAIAVALAANPSNWFARLVLHPDAFGPLESVESFLSRVCQERPYFSRFRGLGLAVIRLIFSFQSARSIYFDKFLDFPNVKESFLDALKLYSSNVETERFGSVLIDLKDPFRDVEVPAPKSGNIPLEILEKVGVDRNLKEL